MADKDYIIPYTEPIEAESSATLCVEFINGKWSRTERDITGTRTGEIFEGIGNDQRVYDAIISYFNLPETTSVPKEEIETLSPGELEKLAQPNS